MNDFFAPAIPADRVLSNDLRVHMVDGDGFEPQLKSQRDYVLIAPVTEYAGEGIYLIHDGYGLVLYRVQYSLATDKPIRLSLDNPLYRHAERDHRWTREAFNEAVLGIVVADIKVRDDRYLRAAVVSGAAVDTGENKR
ncbi:hypothetical protein ACU4I5_18745 [Ensifer adhaerens]